MARPKMRTRTASPCATGRLSPDTPSVGRQLARAAKIPVRPKAEHLGTSVRQRRFSRRPLGRSSPIRR
jgi:hypothetical protein